MRTFIPCFILPISESGRVTVFVSGLNSEYIIAVFSIPGLYHNMIRIGFCKLTFDICVHKTFSSFSFVHGIYHNTADTIMQTDVLLVIFFCQKTQTHDQFLCKKPDQKSRKKSGNQKYRKIIQHIMAGHNKRRYKNLPDVMSNSSGHTDGNTAQVVSFF